jgi:hypothetical protein
MSSRRDKFGEPECRETVPVLIEIKLTGSHFSLTTSEI